MGSVGGTPKMFGGYSILCWGLLPVGLCLPHAIHVLSPLNFFPALRNFNPETQEKRRYGITAVLLSPRDQDHVYLPSKMNK